MLREQRDVGHALAQRRQADRHHVEAIEQIFSEGARRDELLQLAVRGRDEPHVDADGLDAADPLELALLEGAQELHLHLDGDLADLVEEERAAGGELEPARLGRDRAGEGAALVAEQLTLDQLLRDGRAVHLDERLAAARRVVVQRAGDELLAGAALPRDEHRGGAVGHALEHRVDLVQPRGAADDAEARARDEVRGLRRLLPREVTRAQRLGDDLAHLVFVEGLGEVVEGAGLQRLDRGVDGAVRGDHHHGQIGIFAQRLAEQGHAVHLRHAQIGDHEVDVVLAERSEPLLAVLREEHVVAVPRELSR